MTSKNYKFTSTFEDIFRDHHGIFYLVDPDTGEILDANPAACQFYGYTREEITKKNIGEINTLSRTDLLSAMALAKSGKQKYFVFQHKLASGEIRDVELYSGPVNLDGRELLLSIVYDITSRRKVFDQLKASELRYRGIVEDQTEYICRFFPDTTISFVNDAFVRAMGTSREEAIGGSSLRFVHEDDRAELKNAFRRLTRDNPILCIEHRANKPDGKLCWQKWTYRKIFNDKGKFVEYQSIGRDITDRKLAEKALRDSEERFRSAFDKAVVPMVITAPDSCLVAANSAFSRMLGYSETELAGMSFYKFTLRDDVAANKSGFEAVVRGESNSFRMVKRYVCKGGRVIWVDMSTSPVRDESGKPVYFITHAQDITERKLAEEALRESEEQYRKLVQNTYAIILRFDLQGRFTFVNNFAQSFFGYSADELLGRHAVGTIVPERESTGRDLAAMFDEIIGDPDRFITNSNENIRKSGERVWVEWTNSGIFDQEGRLREFLSVGIDITARKRAEEALKESENAYRTIFENTGAATLIIEEDMTISLVNNEFVKLTGYSKAEIEGKETWKKMIVTEDHERLTDYHKMRRQGMNVPLNYETRMLDKQGRMKDLLVKVDVIPGTKRSIASALDITLMKKAEKDLKKRERDLRHRTKKIEEVNSALRTILRARDEEKKEIEAAIYNNLKELVFPYLEKLRRNKVDNRDEIFDVLTNNLNEICSPLVRNLRTIYTELTPKEILVVNLIREGRSSKEISEILNVSTKAVEFHRENIRRKLGMKNKKLNLLSFLLTVEKN